jgi:predicted RNA-binding Zn ribbon-like protein
MTGYSVVTEPAVRQPAPGSLRLVQAFLNTNDIEAGEDRLSSVDGLATWAAEVGVDPGPVDGDAVSWLVRFREALRDTIDAVAWSETPDPDALAVLGDAAHSAPVSVAISPEGGVRLQAMPGGDRLTAAILAAIAVASANGTWQRLKVCRNDACRWSFYDASRNRSGHWCSMAICGNRMKGRAFRRRRQPTGPVSPAPAATPGS